MSKNAAEKKANEASCYILPNVAATRLIVPMNACSLIHFFKSSVLKQSTVGN